MNAYQLAADAVLLIHALFVVFVVLGVACIIAGGLRGWRWVTDPWFRVAHIGAILVVAAQSWFGMICPLTILEMKLRTLGGGTAYVGTFMSHWLASLLYIQAPAWVFTVAYTVFAGLVGATWWWLPPRWRRRAEGATPT